MATQPNTELPASIPPAQTNVMILQQEGTIPRPFGTPPGEQPDMQIHLSRAQLLGSTTLTTDLTVGTEISLFSALQYPILPTRAVSTAGTRNNIAYSCQFYFHQNLYYNSDVVLHFFAVKPPAAIGRLRIVYHPPAYDTIEDAGNREITKVWDLSASNLFEVTLPSYNLRSYKQCMGNLAPLNGASQTFRTPAVNFKMGYVKLYVTHRYQPGSIFPNNCKIYWFQSFQNSQFCTGVGPAVPYERTALSQVINQS